MAKVPGPESQLRHVYMVGIDDRVMAPYPEETGADWTCPSHVDAVATRSTIKVDGQLLMEKGAFVF